MKKILLVLSSALLALTARSNTIVFNDLGPGNTYFQFSGYGVAGSSSSSLGLFEVAAQFTAGASGDLATVDLGLTYAVQGAVNVYLYGDASGSPDNASQTFLGSGTPTAVIGSTNNSLVSFAVAGTIPVTMGTTYWLVLKPTSASMADTWNFSLPFAAGTTDFSQDDSTWTLEGSTLPAFRLTASGVPDSGSTILLMLGSVAATFGLNLLLRRRSQACN